MKDRIFDEEGRVSDFEFDEKVARVFDDMVARSVPYYDEIQRLQVDLAVEFLPLLVITDLLRLSAIDCSWKASLVLSLKA